MEMLCRLFGICNSPGCWRSSVGPMGDKGYSYVCLPHLHEIGQDIRRVVWKAESAPPDDQAWGSMDDPTGDDGDLCEVCGERRDMHVFRRMPGTVFIDGPGEVRCEEWGDAERP